MKVALGTRFFIIVGLSSLAITPVFGWPDIRIPEIRVPLPPGLSDAAREAARVRDQAQAAAEKAKRDAEAAAEKAAKDTAATLEKARKDAEAVAEKAKKDADATLEKAKKDADAALEKAKKDADASLEKARKDAVAAAEKAVKDVKIAVEKAAADTRDSVNKAAEDTRRAYVKGWQDTAGAVSALAKFAERELSGQGKILDAAQRRIAEGKFVDALWHIQTDQLNQTNVNAGAAARESEVLNAAAATAATAYGGPGGAAAYAAWYTYAQTKDLGLALKAGIISGALSVGLPPGTGVGGQVAAGAAKGAALVAVDGGDIEAMKKGMINGAVAGGIQGIGNMPDGTTAEIARKAIVIGAMGGIAVAAAGGDEAAVKDAFLKQGGRVIVQYVQREAQKGGAAAIEKADSICISAVGATCESAAATAKTYQVAAEQGVAAIEGQWALGWDQNVIQSTPAFPSIVITIDEPAKP